MRTHEDGDHDQGFCILEDATMSLNVAEGIPGRPSSLCRMRGKARS